MRLNLILELQRDHFLSIEVFHCAEELRQIVTIANVFVELLELWKDIDEISHNVRENCNSEKQDEGSYKSLNVASWVEVSKAHCREGGECEVRAYNQTLKIVFVLHSKVAKEQVRIFFERVTDTQVSLDSIVELEVINCLAKGQPEYSEQVAQVDDDNDKLEDL